MPYVNSQSTQTLQGIVAIAQSFGDIQPILNVAGAENLPAIAIANDVMNAICAQPFPWKWNEAQMPPFYTNSWQQDYAILYPSGASLTNLAWLERGVAFDINSTSIPKAWRTVEAGRQLPQRTAAGGTWQNGDPTFYINWFPNNQLYYGVWGSANDGNATLGNNPSPGSVYTNPLSVQSMPINPITQIQDANGNYLLLTTYGTEGSTAPLAAANSAAGTTCQGSGATTVWTVVDPYGMGIRMLDVPSETGIVWQINLSFQMQPVRFTSISQTLAPLPDEFEPHFRQMFIAQCYRYSSEAKINGKFKVEWQLAMESLLSARQKADREQEENAFVPARSIMGSGGGGRGRLTPGYPFRGIPPTPGSGW